MNYEILTPDEVRQLAQVATTPAQALDILRRNTELLAGITAGRDVISIGCPHCEEVGTDCSICSWGPAELEFTHLHPCVHQTFGGIKLPNCSVQDLGPSYSYGDLRLECGLMYCFNCSRWTEPFSGKARFDFERHGIRREAERFVRGHIEWALGVLEAARLERVGELRLEEPCPTA